MRRLAHLKYDHLAIIIDDENMLHVAPPNIRVISSNILLMRKRNPFVSGKLGVILLNRKCLFQFYRVFKER